MLTLTQQKILDDLKIEFSKTNQQTTTSGGGLINKAAIDKKLNESNIMRANLDMMNKATDALILGMVERDIDRLNKDLNDMGMWAIHCYTHKRGIGIAPYGKEPSVNYGLNIEYLRKHKTEIIPDGSGYTVYTGFNKILWASAYFDTIDDLVKDKYFMGRIEELYKKILNTKNK